MNRSFLLIIAVLLVQSCAAGPSAVVKAPYDESGQLCFPPMPREGDLVITGKVRLDLPRYRVRGACRIVRAQEGSVRLDFTHSSLFGSYRENATIIIEEGKILLLDNERLVSWDNESALAMLEEHFGFPIYPGDLLCILLLEASCFDTGRGAPRIMEEGADSTLLGEWHGRRIEIAAGKDRLPVSIRFCTGDEKTCYLSRYKYKRYDNDLLYPERIVVEKEDSSERLSLTVTSVGGSGSSR